MADEPEEAEEAPPQTDLAWPGKHPEVILGPDWNAKLPPWGTWPVGVKLPGELRARLRSWQEEFDEGFLEGRGWPSREARSHWEQQAASLLADLQTLFAGRGSVSLSVFPFTAPWPEA